MRGSEVRRASARRCVARRDGEIAGVQQWVLRGCVCEAMLVIPGVEVVTKPAKKKINDARHLQRSVLCRHSWATMDAAMAKHAASFSSFHAARATSM
eukprot:13260716-Alexandrium_andersonii.AAC.1